MGASRSRRPCPDVGVLLTEGQSRASQEDELKFKMAMGNQEGQVFAIQMERRGRKVKHLSSILTGEWTGPVDTLEVEPRGNEW